MKKLFGVIILMLTICLSIGMTACTSSDSNAKSVDYYTEDYSYTNDVKSNTNWRDKDIVLDANTKIDGIFDEVVYNDLIPYKYSASLGNKNYSVSVTPYLGVNGFMVKVIVEDKRLVCIPTRSVHQNSSVILYIAPYNSYNTKYDTNTIQTRVSASGASSQWFGRNAQTYPYAESYIPTVSEVVLRNGEEVVTVSDDKYTKNGNVDIDTGVTGYAVEIFVPYKSMGLTEKPTKLLITPEINVLDSYSSAESNRTMLNPPRGYDDPQTFILFGQGGYISDNANENSMLMGSMGYILPEENNEPVEQKGINDQKLYFKEIDATAESSTNYYIETSINVTSGLNNDGHPKVGILAANKLDGDKSKGNTIALMIDPTPTLNANSVLTVYRNNENNNWVWPNNAASHNKKIDQVINGLKYTGSDKAKLAVARVGSDFYFYVNNSFIKQISNFPNIGATVSTQAGFITMNTEATFSEYQVITGKDNVNAKIAELISGATSGISGLSKQIDGSISDWSGESLTNNRVVRGTTETSRGMDIYSQFIKGEGLYVFAKIYHNTYGSSESNTNNWWLNTNIEFKINDGTQYWVNSYAKSHNYIYAAMVTTEITGLGYKYLTIVEVFVPQNNIGKNNNVETWNAAIPYVKLGLAAKPNNGNDIIAIMHTNIAESSDYWFEFNPNDLKYNVTTAGITIAA